MFLFGGWFVLVVRIDTPKIIYQNSNPDSLTAENPRSMSFCFVASVDRIFQIADTTSCLVNEIRPAVSFFARGTATVSIVASFGFPSLNGLVALAHLLMHLPLEGQSWYMVHPRHTKAVMR